MIIYKYHQVLGSYCLATLTFYVINQLDQKTLEGLISFITLFLYQLQFNIPIITQF